MLWEFYDHRRKADNHCKEPDNDRDLIRTTSTSCLADRRANGFACRERVIPTVCSHKTRSVVPQRSGHRKANKIPFSDPGTLKVIPFD
jgi:hypothetical protein